MILDINLNINDRRRDDQFQLLNDKLDKIMGAFDDVKAELETVKQGNADLQASLDKEQEQVQKLLDFNEQTKQTLEAKIADLEGQLANGATPQQLEELKNTLVEIKDGIAATKADVESTIADQPTDGGGDNTGGGDTGEGDNTGGTPPAAKKLPGF